MADGHNDESGQAMVEAAIVIPFMLFVYMCLFQLILLAHARVLTEYAAFVAVRAGVVNNGDTNIMGDAALMALLPALSQKPMKTMGDFELAWGKFLVADSIGQAANRVTNTLSWGIQQIFGADISGIWADLAFADATIINPTIKDFDAAAGKDTSGKGNDELDFDSASVPLDMNRLTVRVQLLYPLTVPFANRLIFDLWMLYHYLQPTEPLTGLWLNPLYQKQTLDQAVQGAPFAPGAIDLNNIPVSIKDTLYFEGIKVLAGIDHPIYLMPVTATGTMPMESNLYRNFLQAGGALEQ